VLDSKGRVCSGADLDNSTINEKSDEVSKNAIDRPSPTEAASLVTNEQIDILEDSQSDGSRCTGDLKVYAYYAKVAGRWTMASYLVACAAYVFCISFPCKKQITQDFMYTTHTDNIKLYGFNGGPRTMRHIQMTAPVTGSECMVPWLPGQLFSALLLRGRLEIHCLSDCELTP
jgi:hypothetical protein